MYIGVLGRENVLLLNKAGVHGTEAIIVIYLILCLQVTDFTDKVNFYVMNAVTFFKSMWSQVKANAALFVGKGVSKLL